MNKPLRVTVARILLRRSCHPPARLWRADFHHLRSGATRPRRFGAGHRAVHAATRGGRVRPEVPAQTGGADDIAYHAFYGYGGGDEETRTNTFLQDVRKRASSLHYVCNFALTGRKWAAVEYHGRQACALYFDLNADGKLSENERILPTRKADQGVEFITPDFVQPVEGGGQTLCRVLLQVNFYKGNSEPNCMWSPAALLEGAATLNGRPARLLLYASNPGGGFDQYGRSSYSLLLGDQAKPVPGQYVPRETLSSLIASEGQFYHLTLEGRYSNGLPARVLLAKDTSPTGALAVKLVGSNALQATFSSLDLHGAEDKTDRSAASAPRKKK